MGISINLLVAVWAVASAVASGIFWGAYLLGKYISRLEGVEVTVQHHGGRLDRLEARR